MKKLFFIILILGFLTTPVWAATETLDPASDGNTTQWSRNGGEATHWESVDDAIRFNANPAASESTDVRALSDALVEEIGVAAGTFTSISDAQIVIIGSKRWVYCNSRYFF